MFTVVIPLYNKENFILRAVHSVLNQEFIDWELIIVNDGSTDRSLEVVTSISDYRIKILDKVNGGVSSARNFGIDAATYDWICFLDADDYWLPNHLVEIYKLMTNYEGAAAYCTLIGITCSNGIMRINTFLPIDFEGYLDNYFCLAFRQAIFHSSSICVSKEALIQTGYFDVELRQGEDIDMWYRILLRFRGVAKDIITAVYDLETENRAMMLRCKYDNHILSKISKYRNPKVHCLNDYIDYFVLRNSIPFYFSEQKNCVIAELNVVLQAKSFGTIWGFIYSPHLYVLNRVLYKLYKGLKGI